MALKDTLKKMKVLLLAIAADMEKAEAGNKAAAQRVRKNTIAFAKESKMFRKESVRPGSIVRKPKASKAAGKKTAKRSAAPKKKVAAKKGARSKPTTKRRTARRRVMRKTG